MKIYKNHSANEQLKINGKNRFLNINMTNVDLCYIINYVIHSLKYDNLQENIKEEDEDEDVSYYFIDSLCSVQHFNKNRYNDIRMSNIQYLRDYIERMKIKMVSENNVDYSYLVTLHKSLQTLCTNGTIITEILKGNFNSMKINYNDDYYYQMIKNDIANIRQNDN
jgi:hypothetical protein